MILVIGGRSKIGAALIEELLGRGQQVRALVRAREADGNFPAGVEIVTGDLADEGSLVTVMEGIEKVFPAVQPAPRRGQLASQRHRRRTPHAGATAGAQLDPGR